MNRSGELKRGSPIKSSGALKRTAMKRSDPKPPKGPKQKRCANRGCRHPYLPDPKMPFKKWCSEECALALALEAIAAKSRIVLKERRQAAKAERLKDGERRENMKTYPQLVREAQREFNAFIRLRDQLAGYPCVSSGRPLDWSGNAVDAGHYRSVGSAPLLRFNEDNVHAQSKHDNQFKSGNAVDYRIRLVQRIGLDRVEALESNNTPRKWTHDELRDIRDTYRRRVREMKKQQGE